MKELDFDELDRAVNAIIDQRQAKQHTQRSSHSSSDDRDDDEDTAEVNSGYLGGAPSPTSYASGGEDEDETSVPSIDDAPLMDGSSDESEGDVDDEAPAKPSKKRPKRRFMDVKHAGPARGMKVIQPLSSAELTKQGLEPITPASPQLDYTVTSKPFYDIKPVHQKKASDVTFLIDREESTSELIAGDASKGETNDKTEQNDTASYDEPSTVTQPDTDTSSSTVVSPEPTFTPIEPPADDTVDVDDFTDTLESLEVKSLEAAPPPPPPAKEAAAAPLEEPVTDTDDSTPPLDTADNETAPVEASAPADEQLEVASTQKIEPATPTNIENASAPTTADKSPAIADVKLPEPQRTSIAPELPVKMPSQAPQQPITDTSALTAPDEQTLPPMQTPFLSNAKVEKRPLGAHVPAPDGAADKEDTAYVSKQETTLAPLHPETKAEELNPKPQNNTPPPKDDDEPTVPTAPLDTLPAKEESSSGVAEPAFNDDLPAEFQSNLLELEGDSTGQELADETVSTPEDTSEKVAAIGNQQIPRQYHEKKPQEVDTAPIYETDTYHQPMATAKKQKSGWWAIIVIFVVILLGGGGGALFFLMQTGSL